MLGKLDAVLPQPPGGLLAGHDNRVSFTDVRPGAVGVRNLAPAVFAAYVRLLIPLQGDVRAGDSPGRVSWRELASARGVMIHAETPLRALVPDEDSGALMGVEPLIGSMDPTTTIELAATLAAHTSTPHAVFFLYWGGLGGLQLNGDAVYQGPLDVMRDLYPFADHWFQPPTLWWDQGSSWFVTTHCDATSTYVGGSQELRDALLAHAHLDAIEVDLDTGVDDWTRVPMR